MACNANKDKQHMKRLKTGSETNKDTDKKSSLTKNYERQDYTCSVLNGMNDSRKQGQLTDIVLCVDGKEFPCHKVVLINGSDYFKCMFSSGMIESNKHRVTINGVEAVAMETILDYMYTGKISITSDRVQALLEVANLVLVFSLVDLCLSFMFDHIEASNCLGIWQILKSLNFSESCRRAKNYALEHFKLVTCQDEYLDLSVDDLCDFISDTALCVDQEKTVYEAVMKWFRRDTDSRCKDLEKALEPVRFELMDFQYVINQIFNDVSKVKVDIGTRVMCKMMSTEMPERRSTDVVAVVGGSPDPYTPPGFHWWNVHTDNNIYCFNPANGGWSFLAENRHFDIDTQSGVVLYENKICVQCDEMLHFFDMERRRWSSEVLPVKMQEYFAQFDVKWTVVQGKMYIHTWDEDGFYYDESCSIEPFLCYDLSSKALTPCKPPENTVLSIMIAFRTKIFVFGRKRRRHSIFQPRAVMQCYDCESNTWTDLRDIPTEVPMADVNAVVFDRYIYLFQNASRLYVYDAMAEEWLPSIVGIEEHRQYVNCGGAMCNCRLYIMGGQSMEDGTHTDEIYCYDPTERRWQMSGKLKQPLTSPRCVTISKPPCDLMQTSELRGYE
ncbi:kelch-like protein 24 [Ptychodera flava]|uniref:kelch-like protein 24 n=1 Tax=Ptychodera flava TaxID=63121 RepID=UPI00396AA13B